MNKCTRILHVDDDPLVLELVSLSLKKQFNVEIVNKMSGRDAIQLLKSDRNFDCVISDYNMPHGTGGDLFLFLKGEDIQIPFILCSTDSPQMHPEFSGKEMAGYVQKPYITKPLLSLVRQMTKLNEASIVSLEGYTPVNVTTLHKLGELCCDVYVSLNQEKHVLVLRKGAVFTDSHFNRYNKKTERLYIHNRDVPSFVDHLLKSLRVLEENYNSMDLLENLEAISQAIEDSEIKQQIQEFANSIQKIEERERTPHQNFSIAVQTHKVSQKLLRRLGVSPEISQLIKSSVHLAVRELVQEPSVFELFDRLGEGREGYINSHSVLLGQVACVLASKIGWNSNLTRYKLILAAFLHDITLSSDDLARIKNLQQLAQEKQRFTMQQIEEYKAHHDEAAKLAKKIPDFPPDVGVIIEQHHECADGSGFPLGLPADRVVPLAAVFIVAHDLIDHVLELSDKNFSIENFFKANAKLYQTGIFKRIADAVLMPPRIGRVKVA